MRTKVLVIIIVVVAVVLAAVVGAVVASAVAGGTGGTATSVAVDTVAPPQATSTVTSPPTTAAPPQTSTTIAPDTVSETDAAIVELTQAVEGSTDDGEVTEDEVTEVQISLVATEEQLAYADSLTQAYVDQYGEYAAESQATLESIESDLAAVAEDTATMAAILQQGSAAATSAAAQLEQAARGSVDAVRRRRCAVAPVEPPPAALAGRGDLVGRTARLLVDGPRRRALTRAHTALHVLNTVALRDHGGWITGVQIGTEQSRIDFAFAEVSPELIAGLLAKTNAVLAEDHPVTSTSISEQEFRERDDLLRTLEARPPVRDGRVRVVEIAGFDAQACGGTHVHSTGEVGRLVLVRTENKGRQNKRLYVRLEPGAMG